MDAAREFWAVAGGGRPGAGSDSAWLRLGILALDAVKDLFSLDRHALGSIYAKADLISLNAQYRYGDLVTNHHGFTNSTRQDQHCSFLR
jgi:hypothetical protein